MIEDIVYYYVILAISGGVLSVIVHFMPIVNQLEFLGHNDHQFVRRKLFTGVVWFVMATLTILFIAKALLLDKYKKAFIDQSLKSACEE